MFRSYPSVWIGRDKERDILKQLLEGHLSKIINIATVMREFSQDFLSNDSEGMERAFKEIFRLERAADDVKEDIIIQLSKGSFHPMDREDIMRLVLTMDDVAANIKASSRKLLYVGSADVPDEVKKGTVELTNMVYDIVMRLEEALRGLIEGSKDVLRLADNVERKEEEIDDFRVGLIAKVLKWGDKTKRIGTLLMLKEAIENLENASDRTEDVADIIRGIVAS